MKKQIALAILVSSLTLQVRAQNPNIDMQTCTPGYVHVATPSGGSSNYNGAVLMCFNPGDEHIRFVEIRIPEVFATTPQVELTFHAVQGSGKILVIYDQVVQTLGAQTQLAVNTQTSDGSDAIGQYYMRYHVKGK